MKILDTDFLISLLRGDESTKNVMKKLSLEDSYATTVVNAFEVLIGAYRAKTERSTRDKIRNFVRDIDVIDLDGEVADQAAKIQATLMDKGELLEARDVLVAAVASKYKASVVTRNIKHFSRISDVVAEEW
ncbi:MAG: type II toxin-antitoxin system VapC family toxin [Nitrososphaerales archaeon]